MALPLVSIIVRTKDRQQILERALASIAAQTYRPLEVILVNDGGGALHVDRVQQVLDKVILEYHPLPRTAGRAHAANVGLEHAKGRYIGFLDDDDEFYSAHIEMLATSLMKGSFKVAYSSVEFVERKYNENLICESSERKHVFAKPFCFQDLLIANYIPLIALLFDADVLQSLKFDEDFELYEDWDMLIRAGECHPFLFHDRITATYNQWSATQIAFKNDQEAIRQATLKIYEKHMDKLKPETLFSLREKGDEKDRRIKELYDTAEKLRQNLNEKDAHFERLQSGAIWRMFSAFSGLRDRLTRTKRRM
jgi:glycosyltransferase involved in cell wall biosynthesis